MYARVMTTKLKELFKKFPVVAILGPRQSGKTTIAKECFPDLPYINLEDFSLEELAFSDPKGFLSNYPNGCIIDEIQNLPELLSYLQLEIDKQDKPGLYVITGSHQILLNEKISQTLAGRVAILTLLPLTCTELGYKDKSNVDKIIVDGFYPRLHRYKIDPIDFYPSYIQTYVERDVRQIKNITNLSQFNKFIKLCAGRVGQLINFSSLANECGISQVTVKEWLGLLEMSFIIYTLKPYHNNYNKRLVKAPKLYFYDTGLLCNLLDIKNAEQLKSHYARGSIFENFIISEVTKQIYNQGKIPKLYYWRDKLEREVDLIIENGANIIPIEIKSGQTVNKDFFKNINYWKDLAKIPTGYLIYCGDEALNINDNQIINWAKLSSIIV